MATPLPIQLPADVNLDSPQFKLFTQAGRAARPFNAESFQKFLHEDIRHNYLPRSLSEPERNKAEWVEHLAALLGSITMVDLVIHSVTEAPGRLVLHVTASLESSSGTSMTTEEIANEFRDPVSHSKWTALAGIASNK